MTIVDVWQYILYMYIYIDHLAIYNPIPPPPPPPSFGIDMQEWPTLEKVYR